MTQNIPLSHSAEVRYVPQYSQVMWNGRSHDFALVVPVLNEGQRIVDFLTRLKALQIHKFADIVIVDGGSVDGSLTPKLLDDTFVAGHLVKTGRGGLSAQLLAAYDFCLSEGYNGIVTIDGNNKDDPRSIPEFIEKLELGYDFVQASRFLKGGKAKNTPWSRTLAIRLIHAPILSIASGFRWTDTTQGFRAYSRRLLLDPRVDIFREIFSRYELLPYLNYVGPRLKFRVLEVGTTREYPMGEVPTKIRGIAGNIDVFKALLKASFGIFGPRK